MNTAPEELEAAEPEDDALARHKRLIEVLEGRTPMEWSDWTLLVPESKCLTPTGKQVVYWATEVLHQALKADFLPRVTEWLKDIQSKGDPDLVPDSHPIFSPSLWGVRNDSVFVYVNLIRLATQIALFLPQEKTRIKRVLRSLRQNPDPTNWLGTVLQLEVAALGQRASWDILFEPEIGSCKKADVRLINGSTTLLVEATTMRPYQAEQKELAFYERVSHHLLRLGFHHNVRITSKIQRAALEPATVLETWLEVVEQFAGATSQDGKTRHIAGPDQVKVLIVPMTDDTFGERWGTEGESVVARVFERLNDVLKDKDEQAKESPTPVWVRVDEFIELWWFTRGQGQTLAATLAFLAGKVQEMLLVYPNLAGIMLSPGLILDGNISRTDPRYEHVAYQDSIAIRHPVPAYHIRELFIIPQIEGASSEVQMLADLYTQENTWLDWALEQLGQPPLTTFFSE